MTRLVESARFHSSSIYAGMFRADSMDEALKWTSRFLDVHGDEWEIECEVRQLDEECPPQA